VGASTGSSFEPVVDSMYSSVADVRGDTLVDAVVVCGGAVVVFLAVALAVVIEVDDLGVLVAVVVVVVVVGNVIPGKGQTK